MIISGNGISKPLTLKIIDYSYDIDMGLKWFKMGDGSYKSPDRGYENDHTTTTIKLHGKQTYINMIISELHNNQKAGGILNLSNILTPVFGNHIDYTQSITSVLDDITIKEQTSLNGFSLELKLKLGSVNYNTYSLELPSLDRLKYSYKGDSEWSFITTDTYTNINKGGSIDISKFEVDTGKFEGTFKLNYDELGQLLNFQRLNRTLPFDMPTIEGVDYPFGELQGSAGLRAKLYSITDITSISHNLFSLNIVFVQDF